MGKRSAFPRIPQDAYDTPAEAVRPLLPFLKPGMCFAEPCAGAGLLVHQLEQAGLKTVWVSDIAPRAAEVWKLDVLELTRQIVEPADLVITNPPWDRKFLHQLILHLRKLGKPAWLLIDANWAFTGQAAPYLLYCERIVTIGRVKWIPGSTMTGKDDCAWFLFHPHPTPMTLFTGKKTP
jgi:hypothetical protein